MGISKGTHNMLVVKAVISIGFILVLVLPEGWKEASALVLNFLWLWRV